MEHATGQTITERDRKSAQECIACALCRDPKKQGGLPRWSLNLIERMCYYRKGYEKVYGRKAHEVRLDDASRVV